MNHNDPIPIPNELFMRDLFRVFFQNEGNQLKYLRWTGLNSWEGATKHKNFRQHGLLDLIAKFVFGSKSFYSKIEYEGPIGIEYLQMENSKLMNLTIHETAPPNIRIAAYHFIYYIHQNMDPLFQNRNSLIQTPEMRNFKVDGKLHFQNILKEYSETNEQRLTLLEHLHIFYHDLTQFNHDILEQVISKIIEKKLYSLIVKDTRQARYDRGLGSKPKYHKLTKEQKEELLKNMTHDTDARINIQKEVLEKHAKAMSQVVHFTSQYYEKTYSKSEIDFAFLYSRDIVKKRYISDDEDFGNDQFCEACQNSPCICSDPRTSTIDDINITN